ncbi:MAG: hypothetical protein GTO09_10465, partial [Candidatus Latescibacteria bacterium]|nr:hypothetical protein [Candidatus Latescibacterota bacterium]
SFNKDHITEDWLEAVTEVARLPKYQEAVKKMEEAGLKQKLFLPQLAMDKEETLNWIQEG